MNTVVASVILPYSSEIWMPGVLSNVRRVYGYGFEYEMRKLLESEEESVGIDSSVNGSHRQ